MKNSRVTIVAPVHIQPSPAWIDSLGALRGESDIVIVDDSNGKVVLPSDWDVYPYSRQEQLLGSNLFFRFTRFHKSPPCKNFGIWRAWKQGADIIIVIDSDCILPPDFVRTHLEALSRVGEGWENPLEGTGWHSRGFPYHKRMLPVDVHMGLWTNELDINGKDRVERGMPPKEPVVNGFKIAHGVVPLSGMNVSFRREVAPAMMFMPHFDHEEWNFRRHDDIWGGYVLQKIMHKLDRKLSYGAPFVFHDTDVFPEKDAKDEDAMVAHEERFYGAIDDVVHAVGGSDYQSYFKEFTREAERQFKEKHPVFLPLAEACRVWVDKFELA